MVARRRRRNCEVDQQYKEKIRGLRKRVVKRKKKIHRERDGGQTKKGVSRGQGRGV